MDHTDDYGISNRQKRALVILYCGGAVSTIFTGLRVLARRTSGSKLWWDDYIAIVSGLWAWPVYVTCIIAVELGLGKRAGEITLNQAKKIGIATFLHQLAFALSYNLIFVTIFALYFRIFPNPWIRKTSLCLGIFVTVSVIINIIVIIFQCTPVQYFWNKTIPGGHCINQYLCYSIDITVNMIQVFATVLLPIPVLWDLQMPLSKKIRCMVALFVGAFIAITSVARLVYIIRIDSADVFYTMLDPIIWSGLEISVAIVAACMSSIVPLSDTLFSKFFRNNKRDSGHSDGPYSNNVKYGFFKTARFQKSSTTIDTDGLARPGRVLLSQTSRTATDDGDDGTIVDATKPTEGIYITNETVQLSEHIEDDTLSGESHRHDPAGGFPWEECSSTQTQVCRHWCSIHPSVQ